MVAVGLWGAFLGTRAMLLLPIVFPAIMAAGADMLAVISDLFSAPDIRQRALDFQPLFTEIVDD